MADRHLVEEINAENWRTSRKTRCHAGMWTSAYVDEYEDGYFGVFGHPAVWGHTVRCERLDDARSLG